MKRNILLCVAFSIGLSGSLAWAGDDKGKDAFSMDLKVDGVKVGKALSGPSVSSADFKNHVVLIAFWDAKNSASLSRLNEWQKQNADQGLIVIASEAKGASEDAVKKLATEKALKITVTSGSSVDGADDVKDLPHVIVFGHDGKCVYRGSLSQADPKLHEAIAAAPAPALAGVEFKKLAALAASFKKSESPGSVLKQAQTQAESKDAETADEAKVMVEKLTAYGKKEVDEAKAMTDKDFIAGVVVLRKLSSGWAGTEVGKAADVILAGMSKEMVAIGYLVKVKDMETRLVDTADPTTTAFKTKNASILTQMAMTIKEVSKKFPDTKSSAQAVEIANRYKIDLTEKKNDGNGFGDPGRDAGRDAGRNAGRTGY